MSANDIALTVHPKQLSELLAAMMPAREPVLITGAPGIGKSNIVEQAAAAVGAECMVSHPVTSDPTDAKGLPFAAADGKSASWLPYGDLLRAMTTDAPLVWFLDDLGQAAPSTQASFMQLLLAREINGKRISDFVTFVAATNRRSDRAGVSGILAPVLSRFTSIVELEVSVADWTDWGLSNGIHPAIIALMRLKPDALHRFDPSKSKDMVNFACPRTWHAASRILDLNLPDTIAFPALAGAVGAGDAAELVGMIRMLRDLPSPDEVILDPANAVVPESPDCLYAISTAVAHFATAANFGAILQYAKRLPQEFGILAVRDAVKRNKEVTQSNAWMQYVTSDLGRAVIGGK